MALAIEAFRTKEVVGRSIFSAFWLFLSDWEPYGSNHYKIDIPNLVDNFYWYLTGESALGSTIDHEQLCRGGFMFSEIQLVLQVTHLVILSRHNQCNYASTKPRQCVAL